MIKNRYLKVMETSLSAYSIEDIDCYIEEVKKNGLTEHGFGRLTANIGRLIANGKRLDLFDKFLSMMDLCSAHVSMDRAANDFSVSELIECVDAITKSGRVSKGKVEFWKENFSKKIIYNKAVKSKDEIEYNWTLFAALSEFLRMKYGYCPMDMEYIDIQLATQVRHLNKDGMYKDPGCPMVYDIVSRMLFSVLLFYGYNGKYKQTIDDALKVSGLITLKMQSVNGEIPFGGRSNQFYHNEACQCAIFEYEASRYLKEGNFELASRFKRALINSLSSIEKGLKQKPIHHVKNRFPTESKFGCENYAYFNKYMITCASFVNWAMIMSEEIVESSDIAVEKGDVLSLNEDFHKTFLRFGDYFAEIERLADSHYDSSGLGRIHKYGAPPELCISCPGTSKGEVNFLEKELIDFSICAGVVKDDEAIFKTQGEYVLEGFGKNAECVFANFITLLNDKRINFICEVNDEGVNITAQSCGKVAIMLPILYFNGEEYSEIILENSQIIVKYRGYLCRYKTNGIIKESGKIGCNRNGEYKIFYASGDNEVECRIKIE